MVINGIYYYPVKGLPGEALYEAFLNGGISGDREYAYLNRNFPLWKRPKEKIRNHYLHNLAKNPNLLKDRPKWPQGRFFKGINQWDRCPLSIININSVKSLSEMYGYHIDYRRFRMNLLIEMEPFKEMELKEIIFPNSRIEILKPITRCKAINVDPETTQTDNLLSHIKKDFNNEFGVYAQGQGYIRVGTHAISYSKF